MKKITVITLVLALASTAMAENCNSGDLQKDIASIQANNFSEATSKVLIDGSKLAKLSETVACSATHQVISKEESQFAIQYMAEQERGKLQAYELQKQQILQVLRSPMTSESLKNVYLEVHRRSAPHFQFEILQLN